MNHSKMRNELITDLQEIALLHGEMHIDIDARKKFEEIYDASQANEFDDEATAGYKISRWANALKLACVLSAARGDSMIISKEDLELAAVKTQEVADDIPIIFRAVGEASLVSATDKVLRFIELKGYAAREEILKANWRHMTSDDLDRIIVTLREGKIIEERVVKTKVLYFDTRGTVTPP